MPHPDMRQRPPVWMPGKEAIAHICKVEGCSVADAIERLRKTIVAGAVRKRLPDPDNPDRDVKVSLFGPALTSLLGPAGKKHDDSNLQPTLDRESWNKADMRADGTVEFRGVPGRRFSFVVLWDDIRKWEPDSGQGATEIQADPEPRMAPSHAHKTKRRNIPARNSAAVNAAIDEMWPNGVPNDLEAGKRDAMIQEWLKKKGDWDRLFKNTKYESFQKLVQRVLNKRTRRPAS